MGKGKTAQRAARAKGPVTVAPPKPKKHAWFRNPAYHSFEGTDVCLHCKLVEDVHRKEGECLESHRRRMA